MALPLIVTPVDGTGDPVNTDDITGYGPGAFQDVRGAQTTTDWVIIIGKQVGYTLWHYTTEDLRDGDLDALANTISTPVAS